MKNWQKVPRSMCFCFAQWKLKMQKVILRTLFALKTTSPIWNVSSGKCSHWDRGHKLSWNSFPYRKKIHWLWLRACFFNLYSVLKRYMFQSSWQQRENSGVCGQRHCITSLYWNSRSQQRMYYSLIVSINIKYSLFIYRQHEYFSSYSILQVSLSKLCVQIQKVRDAKYLLTYYCFLYWNIFVCF